MTAPFRIAIVGAGPAGFFLAEKLLAQTDVPVNVDLFERLPTPYGLVRFGVAPDHEKIKNVTRSFDKTAARPGFRFFGNVDIGSRISLAELKRHYHAVCFTTGAQTDRRMGIPGEDLAGSHAATEFVAWYNGHPEYRNCRFDLSAERVAVVGVGNVAVDVARMLCRTPEELAETDIADHALEALRASNVREVYLLGRRGPVQAAFTAPEVKELGELDGADAIVRPDEVELDELSRAELEADTDAATKRKVDVVQALATRPPAGKPKRLFIRFLVSPVELVGSPDGHVAAIRLARNRLVSKRGAVAAEPTGEIEELPVGLVFRSVGYRGVALPNLPFDEARGTVPNVQGRVVDAAGVPIPGVYVAGWIKRGPSGVIGTNKPCAGETADALVDDARSGRLNDTVVPGEDPALAVISETVGWPEWVRLQAHETEQGKGLGRPRVKCVDVDEMVRVGKGTS